MDQPVIDLTVAIIGSGFGGQRAAMGLRKAGIDDFRILERRPFMGGTWKQNTYPGAAVDVQSPLYSLAGEPWDWSQMFAERDELAAYTDHLIEKHGLRARTDTSVNVEQVVWHADTQRWHVHTSQGLYRARFVINASGPLSTPVVPTFSGIDTFEGDAFHTNDWDHSVDHRGKRVAIVGSGASAAQVIPAIAPDVAELHVFQRTPHWVMPRPDHVFSPWQRALLRNPTAYTLLRWLIYWSLETRVIGFKYLPSMLGLIGERPARKLLQDQVADPDLRARLTPDYTIGCKRVLLSNTLYPALCQDHVVLHDRHDGIDHLDATGIYTTGGQHVEVDLIVWATGFDATDGAISYPVVGDGGRALSEVWDPYPRAYLGTAVPGFPNFFLVTGPNTGIGHTSALFVIECQMAYILRSIRETQSRGAGAISVQPAAEDDYTRRIHAEMERTVWKQGGCQSWYQSRSGHVVAMFPGFSFTYWRWTRAFVADHHTFSPGASP